MEIKNVKVSALIPYANNAKKHDQTQIDNVAESIRRFGFVQPIVIDKDGVIVIGHCRTLAARQLDIDEVPCVCLDDLTEEEINALRIVDNKTNESDWDLDLLRDELSIVDLSEFDFDFGLDDEDSVPDEPEPKGSLADKFTVPPLSVLDARSGVWQARKKLWNNIIKDDGSGRTGCGNFTTRGKWLNQIGKNTGTTFAKSAETGASVFDPVLAEIICQWFKPLPQYGNNAFDTFSGGAAFGFVSSYMGMNFTGIELREEQVRFNQARMDSAGLKGRYICDDGRNVAKHIAPNSQDLFFSCPPYYDMEVYSDKENDASNQPTYRQFYEILDTTFTEAARLLKDNRFAVVVAQDVRNKKTGGYYGFTKDIKDTFIRNGFSLYDEMVLVRCVGSAAMFASADMVRRKVPKVHEDVLVFYKGDQNVIKEQFGEVDVPTDLGDEWNEADD